MHRKQPTANEDLEIYAPLTPEELERSEKKLAKRKGRFGHHIEIDVPFTNPLFLHERPVPGERKTEGVNPSDDD